MQISLCFRIISFFKKANKLWVSTPRVQPDFCKTLHGNHEEELFVQFMKKHSSLSFLRKRWPSKSWKVCFNLLSSELMCTVLCVDFQASEEGKGLPCYTIVQTVFRLGSNRTAFPSTDFALVSYMGFSKAAWPLLFSWTEHPVYCVLGAVLLMRTEISYVLTSF